MKLNREMEKALSLMENSGGHLFITGPAGSGKSTLLKFFKSSTKKKAIVLAPTGVAALNVNGQTIHSFFGFKPGITLAAVKKAGSQRAKLFRNINSIIIDEVSMLRADLLDCVDRFLRFNGPDKSAAFGGVQMIFIGDLYQLPPVLKPDEKESFSRDYQGEYFFYAKALRGAKIEVVELLEVYRQNDAKFLEILEAIRKNKADKSHLEALNSRCLEDFEEGENYRVYLSITNKIADDFNSHELARIDAKSFTFAGGMEGEFKEACLPTQNPLVLKEGAQIMMLNNDVRGRWVNGDLGKIITIDGNKKSVVVRLEDGREEIVTPFVWEIFKFEYDAKKDRVNTLITGTFRQLPLRLAWAVTIHKGQGKTFDKVIVDFGRGAFAHGQAYVALSRARSLSGIILKRPIREGDILTDPRIEDFRKVAGNH